MRVYLAARYSRNPEMRRYAAQLAAFGIDVTSRWIQGGHQTMIDGEALGADRERLFEEGHSSMQAQRREFAQHDWDDLMSADVVVNFTEKPREASTSRGGRHVEFGAALASGKRVIVVGWRENVFHELPAVDFASTWHEALQMLLDAVEVFR